MTMPDERTRAVLQGGAFLIRIARDKSLPVQLRQQAVMIPRHFPTTEDVSAIASSHVSPLFGSYFADPAEVEWQGDPTEEPLTRSTRFGWPTDETGSER